MTTPAPLRDRLEAALVGSPDGALFVTELARRLDLPDGLLDADLDALRREGAVLITDHTAPDEHVSGDFRVVALSGPDAGTASDIRWNRWMRGVLAVHRCG